MRRPQSRNDAFESRQFHEVFSACSSVAQVYSTADGGIIKTSTDGMRELYLTDLVLKNVKLGFL